jgi:hypothetical protein
MRKCAVTGDMAASKQGAAAALTMAASLDTGIISDTLAG